MSRTSEASPRRSFAEWYFQDSRGQVVHGQPPNRAITILFGLQVSQWALRRGGLLLGSPLDVALDRARTLVLIWWSADELLRGATPYRRTLGAAALLHALRDLRRGGRRAE